MTLSLTIAAALAAVGAGCAVYSFRVFNRERRSGWMHPSEGFASFVCAAAFLVIAAAIALGDLLWRLML